MTINNPESYVVFDIETAPLPEDQLKASMPDFKPAANLKDPEKIKASIEEKREAYLRDAALSPLTGRILAVGVRKPTGDLLIAHGEDEADILRKVVAQLGVYIQQQLPIGGFKIRTFDLPYIRFRCAVHGISSVRLMDRYKGRTYWHECFVDLYEEVVMGRERSGNDLDSVCKALGIPGKTGSGAHFAQLYKDAPESALDYLRNDLRATAGVYERIML
jgi:hypothetical protein